MREAVLFHAAGDLTQAEPLYRKVLAHDGRNPEALNYLGALLLQRGETAEAEEILRSATAAQPGLASAHANLGIALQRLGRAGEAAESLRRAVELKPGDPKALSNLGAVLKAQNRIDEAEATLRRALAMNPRFAEAHSNLGTVLGPGRRDEALACFDGAIASDPNLVDAHFNRASTLKELGLTGESIAAWRRTVELAPHHEEARSNLLLTLRYSDEVAPLEILAEHRKYEAVCAGAIQSTFQRHGNDRDPARRLRIGYLSPDLRHHSVAYFVEPVLAHHDDSAFEITCYHSNTREDDVTGRLKQLSARWRSCAAMSDQRLAQTITEDRIDILIDLAGHTGGRMPLFARKPAPVQAAWLGYPASTGLSAMDYRITDGNADPAGYDELNSERLVRLPGSYFCYRPPNESPQPAPPPALERACITFGSFNNISKLSPSTIRLWSRVLREVPGSRLLLKAEALAEHSARRRILERFGDAGIDAARLDMRSWESNTAGHLAAYAGVDIALDTGPYNGATTTCEALWMGVPVVTLAGDRSESRMGASILSAAGCRDWIADGADEYVAIAGRLAAAPDALHALRAGMRERLRASPLLDGEGFTRGLETAYRRMWQEWCRTSPV